MKSPSSSQKRGNVTPAEIKPLVIAARRAFDIQRDLGNTDLSFDAWRSAEVLAAVGRAGITACNHEQYRPLMAHFQILAGRDEKAYQNLTTTGPASGSRGDSHERRRILANQILEAVRHHCDLGDSDPADPADPALAAHREAIQSHGGPIREGYVIFLARQKTRRPNLVLRDLATDLPDRCTVAQLEQIRNTVINRISAKEGRGSPARRNKKQSLSERCDSKKLPPASR